MDYGVDMAAPDSEGKTILHHIALHGSLTEEALRFLLEDAAVKMNVSDVFEKTALEITIENAAKDHDPRLFDSARWERTRLIFEQYGALTLQRGL